MNAPLHVLLETLDNVNRALADDRNALVVTRGGSVNPSAAYVELVRELVQLMNENRNP